MINYRIELKRESLCIPEVKRIELFNILDNPSDNTQFFHWTEKSYGNPHLTRIGKKLSISPTTVMLYTSQEQKDKAAVRTRKHYLQNSIKIRKKRIARYRKDWNLDD